MEAEELQRATMAAQQDRKQARARLTRERRLAGSQAARRELAQDFSAVNATERRRAAVPAPITPPS